ncbi:hypothetical protein D9M72_597490 [compost metagenome]
MGYMNVRIGRRTLAAFRIDGRAIVSDFGFDKHLGECRMCCIAVAVRQHQFGIRRDFNHAIPRTGIDDIEPAAFTIRF